MAFYLLGFGFGFIALVVIFLLNRYGDCKNCHLYAAVTLFLTWFFAFSNIVLLPIDISSSKYDYCIEQQKKDTNLNCELPWSYVPANVLKLLWEIIYWNSFFSTWAVIPILQYYVDSGEFRFIKKLKTSIKQHLMFYAILGSVALIGVLYMIFKLQINTWEALLSLGMSASNAWGLFWGMSFLGHGLVDVPRNLWRSADKNQALRRLEHKAPHLKDDLDESKAELKETLIELERMSNCTPENSPLRPFINHMLKKTVSPHDFSNNVASKRKKRSDIVVQRNTNVDMKSIVNLHYKLKSALKYEKRNSGMWKILLEDVFQLQDILNSKKTATKLFTWSFPIYSFQKKAWIRRLAFIVFVYIDPIFRKLFAILLALASAAIIWSEITLISTNVDLSLLGLLLHMSGLHSVAVEFLTVCFISYICFCAYTSLLKMKLFKQYKIVKYHSTDERSLLFIAAYLCRLTLPLCYNFWNLIGAADGDVYIQFSLVMGKINLLPLLGDKFNLYVPILVGIVCVTVLFNLHERLLKFMGIDKLFLSGSASRFSSEYEEEVAEGRILIQQARDDIERDQRRKPNVDSPAFDRSLITSEASERASFWPDPAESTDPWSH